MADQRANKLAMIVQKIYDELRQAEDEALSREQIHDLLGKEYEWFYRKDENENESAIKNLLTDEQSKYISDAVREQLRSFLQYG
jgi:hypothetical protein